MKIVLSMPGILAQIEEPGLAKSEVRNFISPMWWAYIDHDTATFRHNDAMISPTDSEPTEWATSTRGWNLPLNCENSEFATQF